MRRGVLGAWILGVAVLGGVSRGQGVGAVTGFPGGFGVRTGGRILERARAGLHWGTYVGGGGFEELRCLAVARNGDLIAAGVTQSRDFPVTAGAYQRSFGGQSWTRGFGDVVVLRMSADGKTLRFATYVGGAGGEEPFDMQVMPDDSIWVAGLTRSKDFPRTPNAWGPPKDIWNDAFVFHLSADGSKLLYSTAFGGYGGDVAYALHVEPGGGRVWLAGMSNGGVPTTRGAFRTRARGREAWLAILDLATRPGATTLAYGTFLGGSGDENRVFDLHVDAKGRATLVGLTESSDFPVTALAAQPDFPRGSRCLFLATLDPTKTGAAALLYGSFLGGGGEAFSATILEDAKGVLTVGGCSAARNMVASLGAFQTSYGGGKSDGFLIRVDRTRKGRAGILYATYFGGDGIDRFPALLAEADGTFTLAGGSDSSRLPVTAGAFQESRTSGPMGDGYLCRLDPSRKGAGALRYGSYFGGCRGGTSLLAAARTPRGLLALCGTTVDPWAPVLPGAFRTRPKVPADAYLALLNTRPLDPAYSVLGKACRGSAGLPQLRPLSPARLCGRVRARVRGATPKRAGVMLLGFSTSSWATLVLPAELGRAGMSGCVLYASGEVLTALPTGNGVADWGMDLPWRPELVGLRFYNQYVFLDAKANPFGLVLTNALQGEVRF